MWVKVAGIILRNRISILVILGILTLFMAFQSQRIEMSYQYAPLLPEDDPVFLDNEYFVQEFGNNSEMVVLAVQDSAFFNTEHLQQWLQLKDELVALEGVSGVFSVLDAYDLVRNADARKFEVQSLWTEGKAESIAQFTQRLSELPLYEHLLYNSETHTYLMAVFLVPEILQSPERVALIEGIKAAGARFDTVNGTRLYYSGLPYIRVETAEMVKRELNMFIFLTLGVTALVIFLFFRSFKVVLFAMLVVSIAVIWALGSQALLGYKITILTGMIPPLLIVIGIPNSVFMLNKYHQEFRLHGKRIKSLQRMIRKIGNATFLTNLTTASGFITFVFTSSRLLVEFGIVAAINIMVVFFNGTSYLIRNLLLSLGFAVVLFARLMAWMCSSKRMVLVSLIPNLVPLLATAALMGYFGIPVRPSAVLVFSIAFGISVDDTIHFLAKYRQELSETSWSIRAAVMLATKETGLSMIYTSIILFFGFGVFSLSEFGGTVALGLLVAFTLFVAMFSNLILLPTLLLTLERLITNQSFKEPLLAIYNEEEDIEHSKLVIARKGSASSEDCSAESSSKDPLD